MPIIIRTATNRTVPKVSLASFYPSVGSTPSLQTNQFTLGLKHHVAVLQSMGIDDLSKLGTLEISGNVIPQVGFLRPGQTNLYVKKVPFSKVWTVKAGSTDPDADLELASGEAYILPAESFTHLPIPKLPGNVPDNLFSQSQLDWSWAYWGGKEIIIENDTLIILQKPAHYLVMIAEKITIGNNVTLSWDQPSIIIPQTTSELGQLNPPPTSIYSKGTNGQDGKNGDPGGRGQKSVGGPEVEIVALDMNHLPENVLLSGQDGGKGGKGQNGQDGQDGAKGKSWVSEYAGAGCKNGPGNGGDGGDGGDGGKGGKGGEGGHGGRLSIYTSDTVWSNIGGYGFYLDTKEGAGGEGGDGGSQIYVTMWDRTMGIMGQSEKGRIMGGHGGFGGKKGHDRPGRGCPTNFGNDGANGKNGKIGDQGDPGDSGEHYGNEAIRFVSIDKATFYTLFNKPAIFSLSVSSAHYGDTISISGRNFTNQDKVFVDNTEAVTTYLGDTSISFVVPSVEGGAQRPVYIKQTDGTTSNRATLEILPTILYLEQDGKKSNDPQTPRFSIGRRVTLVGQGFSDDLTIKINDSYVPTNDIQYAKGRATFTLYRPGSTVPNPDGEQVTIEVILADVPVPSKKIQITLDTLVMVVFGDSIQWGQGLREDLKFHSLVENYIRQKKGMSVYKKVYAHSGATIGVGDNASKNPVDGEIPTAYPTILQQVSSYPGDPGLVDLVLIDGGANDISMDRVVNPLDDAGDIVQLAEDFCYRDMSYLLYNPGGTGVAQRFPNANVIVTGYYPIVSQQSDLSSLIYLLSGLGALAGSLVGLPIIGGIIGAVVTANQKDVMVSRSARFAKSTNLNLQKAVNDANTNLGLGIPSRIFFAKPDFKGKNAIFTGGSSWVWGIEADLDPADDEPSGGVDDYRTGVCVLINFQEPGRSDQFRCIRASIGHPNVKGAIEYARVINDVLSTIPNFP